MADAQVIYGFLPQGAAPTWDEVEHGGGGLRIIERRTSQSDGAFSMDVDDDQGTLFIVSKLHRRLSIPAARRSEYQVGDQLVIHLSTGASLSGKVFLGGSPATGVTVQLATQADATLNQSSIGSQRTDGEGAYRWDGLDAGDYELTVLARPNSPVYPFLSRRCALKQAEQKTLNLGNDLGSASLSGAVFNRNVPVPNVTVTLRPLFDWDYTLIANHSDEDGIYMIEGLRPGSYRAELVQINATPGQERLHLEETVEVRGQTEHDFEFQPKHALTARLFFQEGFPPDLRGRLQSAGLSAREFALSLIGADGIDGRGSSKIESGDRIRFEGRYKGSYTISLNFGGQSSTSEISLPETHEVNNLEADQDLGDLTVTATGELQVRLVYASGQPAGSPPSQLHLFIQSQDGPAAASGAQLTLDPARTEQTVGPIGVGRQKVFLLAFGYKADPPSQMVAIEPGKAAGPLTFNLSPEGMILHLTMERPSGAGAPSKMIRASRITLSGQGVQRTLIPQEGANVDIGAMLDQAMTGKDWAAGPAFMFRDLKPGAYQVTIEAPGYQTLTAPVQAIPGQLNSTPMALVPLGR